MMHDLLIASDTSATETKKITFLNFKNSIASGGGLTDIVQDTTPQLGGNLDVNSKTITSASNGNVDIDPDGTGDILLGNNTQVDGATDYFFGMHHIQLKVIYQVHLLIMVCLHTFMELEDSMVLMVVTGLSYEMKQYSS